MSRWATRFWQFLREVSGEAALERRMALVAHAQGPHAQGPHEHDGHWHDGQAHGPSSRTVDAALKDTFEGVRRCC